MDKERQKLFDNIPIVQHLVHPILDRIDELNEKIIVLDGLSNELKEEVSALEKIKDQIQEKYPTPQVRTVIKSIKLDLPNKKEV